MEEQTRIEQQAVTEKVTHAEQMIKDCLEALDDMAAQSKIDDKGRQLEVRGCPVGLTVAGQAPSCLPPLEGGRHLWCAHWRAGAISVAPIAG